MNSRKRMQRQHDLGLEKRWLAGAIEFETMGTLSYGLWHGGQRLETDRKIHREWNWVDSSIAQPNFVTFFLFHQRNGG